MSAIATPTVPTTGLIARRLKEPLWRVEYVIRTRNIRPISRAGNLRVFDEPAVQQIAAELRRIDAERRDCRD